MAAPHAKTASPASPRRSTRAGGASSFALVNKTGGRTPTLPFKEIKERILGARYELSVALVTPKEARRITLKTKRKKKASNVLSFPLSPSSGEILLCPATARAQARAWHKTQDAMLAFLFIHGLLHLKGCSHSATMEREERSIAQRFGF